jgi:hypothetical protein
MMLHDAPHYIPAKKKKKEDEDADEEEEDEYSPPSGRRNNRAKPKGKPKEEIGTQIEAYREKYMK